MGRLVILLFALDCLVFSSFAGVLSPISSESFAGDLMKDNFLSEDYKVDSEIIDIVKEKAEMDDAEAQMMLGYCYYFGDGIEQNDELAYHWLLVSSRNGYESASRVLKELGR